MKPMVTVTVLIALAGLVGTLVGRSTRPATAPKASRQAQVDAGMDRIIPIIHFDKTPLDKAVDALREATHANIQAKWRLLESAGIDQQTPVTLNLKDVPLSQALDFLCDEAGAGSVRLAARADRGVIVITTEEDVSREVESRVYDVRDLVVADAQFMSGGSLSLTAPSPTTTAPSPGPVGPYSDSLDRLKQIVTDSIAPDSWRDAGGTVSSILDFDGLLIIVTTPEYHQQIADLLDKIRARGQ